MKAKQIKNKLILTWEKDDEIKVGETITIDLSKKKIIALFGFPQDYSVRSNIFSNMTEVKKYEKRWNKISYLICAFEVNGNYIIRTK